MKTFIIISFCFTFAIIYNTRHASDFSISAHGTSIIFIPPSSSSPSRSPTASAVISAERNCLSSAAVTEGATNIFKYPELADQKKASDIINTFEEKQMLTELVQDTLADESSTGIQVYIGNETPIQTMKDCSVVTATYELGEGMRGTIGIIGPKRMDYDKVVGTLKTITHQLDELYRKKT